MVVLAAKGIEFNYSAVLTADYGHFKLRCPEFAAHKAQIVFVVGANGSGKTTLLRLLSGEIKPSAGSVTVASGTSLSRAAIYFSGTDARLLVDNLTILDHVVAGLQPDQSDLTPSGPPTFYTRRVSSMLQDVSHPALRPFLEENSGRRVRMLSSGQRQLLLLALMTLRPHEVLLVDEPSNYLDYANIDKFFNALRQMLGSTRVAVVVTHNYEIVSRYKDAVYIVDQGDVMRVKEEIREKLSDSAQYIFDSVAGRAEGRRDV